jgi:hypothetical protein
VQNKKWRWLALVQRSWTIATNSSHFFAWENNVFPYGTPFF